MFGFGRERKMQKNREQVDRMMTGLYNHYKSMTPKAIIDELEEMHQIFKIPSWVPVEERGGYFYKIVKHLYRSPLTKTEIHRLVAMLLYPELRLYGDRSVPYVFVLMAGKNPSKDYLSILETHLDWLQKRKLEIPCGTHEYAALLEEIKDTEQAISAAETI